LIQSTGERAARTTCVAAPTGVPLSQQKYTKKSIYFLRYNCEVEWDVLVADEFEPEFQARHTAVQDEILALSQLLRKFGPQLGRRAWTL
jgi:hypothetical protein